MSHDPTSNSAHNITEMRHYAHHLLRTGRRYEYIELLTQLLEDNPSNPDLGNDLARSFFKIGRRSDAIEYYNQVLFHNPGNSGAITGLAKIYFQNGEYALAEETLSGGHKINPHNPEILQKLAGLYGRLGRFGEGIKILEDLMARNARDTKTLYEFGKLLARESTTLDHHDAKTAKLTRAQSMMTGSHLYDPHNTRPLNALAIIYAMQNNFRHAEGALEQSLDLNHHEPNPYETLGLLALKEKRHDKVDRVIRRAPLINARKRYPRIQRLVAKNEFLRGNRDGALEISRETLNAQKKVHFNDLDLSMMRIYLASGPERSEPLFKFLQHVLAEKFAFYDEEAVRIRTTPSLIKEIDGAFFAALSFTVVHSSQRPNFAVTPHTPLSSPKAS